MLFTNSFSVATFNSCCILESPGKLVFILFINICSWVPSQTIQNIWKVGLSIATYEALLVAQLVKNLPAMQETLAWFLGQADPWIRNRLLTLVFLGFPGDSDGKESVCNMGDHWLDPWVGKIPWRIASQPSPVFLPGEFYGQRSLVGYSPWGHKELNTTEWLNTQHTCWALGGFPGGVSDKEPAYQCRKHRDMG